MVVWNLLWIVGFIIAMGPFCYWAIDQQTRSDRGLPPADPKMPWQVIVSIIIGICTIIIASAL